MGGSSIPLLHHPKTNPEEKLKVQPDGQSRGLLVGTVNTVVETAFERYNG